MNNSDKTAPTMKRTDYCGALRAADEGRDASRKIAILHSFV